MTKIYHVFDNRLIYLAFWWDKYFTGWHVSLGIGTGRQWIRFKGFDGKFRWERVV